jgi:1-deoxy-D-xylulose-5-phosphate synthase
MDDAALAAVAEEMRGVIIETVSQTGGHLGSSLGTVELSIALHAELESPRDRILWDVGHQAYGHKLLTGRLGEFDTLRQHQGLSGFLRREESEHDIMGAGHASTSISYAVGLAEAMRVGGRTDRRVVAVIGDGALTGGMAYEGLNQAGHLQSPLTVVLNDNGMSISENVGALAGMLQKARLDPTLSRVRHELERGLKHVPGVGHLGESLSNATKALFVPGQLFEALGFAYLGPIDGHDINALRGALQRTADLGRPVLLHVHTQKGRGYGPAESDGEAMHGSGPFAVESGRAAKPSQPAPPSYTEVFGKALVREADADPRVVAITAAMPKGTGTNFMMDRFPERTYDVGIAEQHGVVFAAGLAIAGYRPVCAMYSTFLQRAYDPIVHDVALQGLPVVFAIDRGGLVGDDGPTHHGVFDIGYLRPIPGMVVMAPKDEAELVDMLHTALRIDGPSAIRYPRGSGVGTPIPDHGSVLPLGKAEVLAEGSRVALVGYGYGVQVALDAAGIVSESLGVPPTVVNARFVKPLDVELLEEIAATHEVIVTIEDHALEGGFGSAVVEALPGAAARIERIGIPDRFIQHGRRDLLLAEASLTPAAAAAAAIGALRAPVDG